MQKCCIWSQFERYMQQSGFNALPGSCCIWSQFERYIQHLNVPIRHFKVDNGHNLKGIYN